MAVDEGEVPHEKSEDPAGVSYRKADGVFLHEVIKLGLRRNKVPRHPRPPTASLNYSSSPN